MKLVEIQGRARALEDEGRRRDGEAERAGIDDADRAATAELAVLRRLGAAASRAETLEEAYAAALDGIATALGVERASILLFDSDGVIRFKAWRGLSDAYRQAVEGHTPWRQEDSNPEPVVVEDVRHEPTLERYLGVFERESILALGFFPLSYGGRLLGKFMVYHPHPHVFTDRERRLAGAIADEVALAVDRNLCNLERERMLGIIGHDLRNPLNAIVMSAASLLRQELPESVLRSVRRITTSAERMARLMTQLLEFAQARHALGISLRCEPADLAEVARHAIDEIEAAYPDRAVALDAEGDLRGEWDPVRLGEVLSNLVLNALQHGGLEPVTVRLRGSGGDVTAEVHNRGSPIPGALLPHLFDPFRRGVAGPPSAHRGVGLGLFVSREIVRAHGGIVAVTSTAADGTTFAVTLPRRRAARA
ncbi:MAG TPA: GAF domain-containing sensor histidine kinase [Anaeromyxobacteraceae bacterium]|nr:GAF domain-containing sensor histidine kinase [Anaeromyxobacteraceae bacterium]